MTMARLARSLEVLREEVNQRWPNRSKASDGWIADAAHGTQTDHYPNQAGVVCALDITSDPNGPDSHALGELLRLHPHPDVKYVIDHPNRRMWSSYPARGVPPYTWRDYPGPKANELHVSVGRGSDGQSSPPYDDTNVWLTAAPAPLPEDDMTPEQEAKLNEVAAFVGQFKRGEGFVMDPLRAVIADEIAKALAKVAPAGSGGAASKPVKGGTVTIEF